MPREAFTRQDEREELRAANDNCYIRLVVDNRRTRTLTYDNAGRITAYTDTNPTLNQSFGYDANDRLTSWTGGWGIAESYTYDANGNRRTVSVTGQTLATLAFPTTNNKFTSQTGGGNMPFTPVYDATGNMTAINNGITLVYDGRNRVASSTAGGITTNYWVNGLGQRVRKTWNGTPTASHVLFTYDPSGKHIGSYDLNGALTEETIFLGDTPIATVTGAGTFNLYADHINAIRQITNQTNQTRWSWEQTNAFGSTLPNQNPAGLGTFNYRRGFPGQFYDAELLTWNNGFRTYHAGIGRYLQPDPIGLMSGSFSGFGYVDSRPSMAYDTFGLRLLTPGEIALARKVFGDTIDYSKVNLYPDTSYNQLQGQNTTVTPDGNMYFPKGSNQYREDFAGSDNECHFMHEMMHVYQKQVLHYDLEALAALGWTLGWVGLSDERDYQYMLVPGKSLLDYGMEQQASIVADYYGGVYLKRPPSRTVPGPIDIPSYGHTLAPILPPINSKGAK